MLYSKTEEAKCEFDLRNEVWYFSFLSTGPEPMNEDR